MNLFELHERMTGHLFPAYSNTDERFLALALCGEVGELANMIKKRWRDGADLSEEIKDELADIRVYLELLAKCFDIEGHKLDQRVFYKLQKVVEKHKDRILANTTEPDMPETREEWFKQAKLKKPKGAESESLSGICEMENACEQEEGA